MKQCLAANPIDAATQGEIIDLSLNCQRWFSLRRNLFTNCFGETGYIATQFIEEERSGSARRQNTGRANHLKRALRSNSIECIIQQFLLNVVAIEPVQRKRLAILHFFALTGQLYSKQVPHKKFRRMRKEFH